MTAVPRRRQWQPRARADGLLGPQLQPAGILVSIGTLNPTNTLTAYKLCLNISNWASPSRVLGSIEPSEPLSLTVAVPNVVSAAIAARCRVQFRKKNKILNRIDILDWII